MNLKKKEKRGKKRVEHIQGPALFKYREYCTPVGIILFRKRAIAISWPCATNLGQCFCSSDCHKPWNTKIAGRRQLFPRVRAKVLEKHHNAKHRLPYVSSKSCSTAPWQRSPLRDIKDKRHHFWLRKSFLEAERILWKYQCLLAPFWTVFPRNVLSDSHRILWSEQHKLFLHHTFVPKRSYHVFLKIFSLFSLLFLQAMREAETEKSPNTINPRQSILFFSP